MAELSACSVDAQFPQLEKVLDSEFMRDFLQAHWLGNNPQNQLVIAHVKMGERRHKPGKEFRLTYELTLLNGLTQEVIQELATIKLLNGFLSSEYKSKALESGTAANNQTISYLPELAMLLWRFPHDDVLIHLPLLHDAKFLISYFNNNRELTGLGTYEKVEAVSCKVMHYLPEKSCMTRYELTIRTQTNNNNVRTLMLFGKNYQDDSGRQAYQNMSQLAGQTAYFANPLGYDSELNTLWQAQAPGKPLEWGQDLLLAPRIISLLADCLAAFHNSRLEVNKTYEFNQIFKQLNGCAKLASKAALGFGLQINGVIQNLITIHQRIDWSESPQTLLHMDLKMGNLLIARDRVRLIDLDGLCLGDPLADLGSFIANLYLNGLRAKAPQNQIDQFVENFVQAYQQRVIWLIDKEKLDWYVAAALIHEVLRRSIRQQDTERLKLGDDFIRISQNYMTRAMKNLAG